MQTRRRQRCGEGSVRFRPMEARVTCTPRTQRATLQQRAPHLTSVIKQSSPDKCSRKERREGGRCLECSLSLCCFLAAAFLPILPADHRGNGAWMGKWSTRGQMASHPLQLIRYMEKQMKFGLKPKKLTSAGLSKKNVG